MATLATLLDYPFQLIRLGAYWNRIEDGPGRFDTGELDRQVEAAERAGKQIIVCVGAVKTFGYPEFFVPAHHLPEPLREGPWSSPPITSRCWTRRRRSSLGWCGDTAIARRSSRGRSSTMRSTRSAWNIRGGCPLPSCGRGRGRPRGRPDPAGHDERLPADSAPVRLQQWWRTRDQGDSLVVAQQLADIVGVDFYPRHASGRGRADGLPGRQSARCGGGPSC